MSGLPIRGGISFRGVDLGEWRIPLHHPWHVRFSFSEDVTDWEWLAQGRINPDNDTPTVTLDVSPESAQSVIVSLTREQVESIGLRKATCALDQVSPDDRELFRFTLSVVQDVTYAPDA